VRALPGGKAAVGHERLNLVGVEAAQWGAVELHGIG
jgi:hypothetical protein